MKQRRRWSVPLAATVAGVTVLAVGLTAAAGVHRSRSERALGEAPQPLPVAELNAPPVGGGLALSTPPAWPESLIRFDETGAGATVAWEFADTSEAARAISFCQSVPEAEYTATRSDSTWSVHAVFPVYPPGGLGGAHENTPGAERVQALISGTGSPAAVEVTAPPPPPYRPGREPHWAISRGGTGYVRLDHGSSLSWAWNDDVLRLEDLSTCAR